MRRNSFLLHKRSVCQIQPSVRKTTFVLFVFRQLSRNHKRRRVETQRAFRRRYGYVHTTDANTYFPVSPLRC